MALLLSMTAWSQDPAESPAAGQQKQDQDQEGGPDDAGDESAEAAEPEVAEVDDSALDDQTYGGDDDEFIPTEEVPMDEPIPFPSDI